MSKRTIWEAAAELKRALELENEPPVLAGCAGSEAKVTALQNHVVIEVRVWAQCLRVVVSPKVALWKALRKLWVEARPIAVVGVVDTLPPLKKFRGWPVHLSVSQTPRSFLTPAGTLSAEADG